MNSLLASNINGGFNNQQVANGSSASILLSSIDFTVTGMMTNSSSSQQGKSIIKLTGTEDVLYNGQNKIKSFDQNKNTIENHVTVNGNNKDKSSEDTIPVPKVQLFTGKIHVEWNQVYKIGAGLSNLGNTCFMNTVMQCLTYCPPLANYLLHDDHASKCTITGFCMMCLLQKHMKRTIGKTGEVIKPLDIYQRLKLIAKHFQFGRQEDAHEFLRYVIDHLWKSCLTQVNGVKLDSATKETTVINKIFGGYHRSQVICLRCKKKSNTFDHFMDFILDIKQNVMSLEKALERFTQPELLQQDNCYKCPKCKMKVEAQKRFSVFQAPVVATFQLKRFDYNRSFGGKITKQITYPEKLNLRPYMSDVQGEPVWYRLNAVLVHSGPSCNSGHYYCYVKNSNGYWYIMDDQRVHQVSLNQVLNQSAYVLFYIKVENGERAPLKKCLDNKSAFMKGTISNSHFTSITEVNNVMKPIALSDKISPFACSKPFNSLNNVKKLNFSPTREKVSFGFRTNPTSTQTSSPKGKASSSECVSTMRSGLVPYMEDSSESSDASESCPSQNKSSSIANTDVKPLSKTGSLASYKSSPHLEVKRKVSKFFNTSSYSLVNNTPHKVSATSSWIVTDAPQSPISSRSCSSNVNSTTDWHVIEASDLTSNDSSSKLKESKNHSKKESLNSPKVSVGDEMSPSKHSVVVNDQSSNMKLSNEHENSPSVENCNFRKQNKTHIPEDKETFNSFKRKYSDSNSKVSNDSTKSEHSENRCSPLPKKVKYAENSSFLNFDKDIRNSETNDKNNNSKDTNPNIRQKQYTPVCDNSRTSFVNGVSNLGDNTRINSPNKNSNSIPTERNLRSPEKDTLSSKGHKDKSSECANFIPYEKDKQSVSNKGNNSFLFGTEVPTWREENHYRPSLNSGHEVRRSFDDYDNELDRGKVRKSKNKDRYHHFHEKNPFQKYADRYHGKYNGRYYNTHHNFRKHDSRYNWKSNHKYGYPRYHNQHHRY